MTLMATLMINFVCTVYCITYVVVYYNGGLITLKSLERDKRFSKMHNLEDHTGDM
jgi:hypothetical protein